MRDPIRVSRVFEVARPGPQRLHTRQHLAVALRRAREDAGVTQLALATSAGLHDTVVSQLERGIALISDDRLCAMEAFLGCEPGILVRAAARDRGGITIPTGLDGDGDEVTVLYALRARNLSQAARAAIRQALLAG